MKWDCGAEASEGELDCIENGACWHRKAQSSRRLKLGDCARVRQSFVCCAMSSKLWVVSAPNEGGRSSFESIRRANTSICQAFRLPLPSLRVGTLDSLISVSDAVARDDKALEMTVERVLRQYQDLVPAGSPTPLVDEVDVFEYATDFEWDEAKFASSDALGELRKTIMDQVARLEEDMKIRSTDYSATKQALTAIARKSQGNLMSRSLATVVTAKDVTESEHMTTAFVVFPSYMKDEFLNCYEELADLVVPRSAREIETENDYALYGVTVFKKDLETFKTGCRDKRFTVREYKFEPDAATRNADEEARLTDEAEEQHAMFAKWAETAFAETFIAMTHLKVLRVFVESVLRYGLPVNFDVALLLPKSKSDARLRASLNDMFGHLGGSWAASNEEDGASIPGLGGDKDFFPYVSLDLVLPKV